jgi:hypothetical protein
VVSVPLSFVAGMAVSLRWPEAAAYAKSSEAEARVHLGAAPGAAHPVPAPTTSEPAEVSAG